MNRGYGVRPPVRNSGGGAFSNVVALLPLWCLLLPLTLNATTRSLLSVLEQLVAFCKRHCYNRIPTYCNNTTTLSVKMNNNNNNTTRFSVNNNNNNNENNNIKFSSACASCQSKSSSSLSHQPPPPIQVTAKVLFGSVTAISALNAERKKKS